MALLFGDVMSTAELVDCMEQSSRAPPRQAVG
jgi:hypothetical protein